MAASASISISRLLSTTRLPISSARSAASLLTYHSRQNLPSPSNHFPIQNPSNSPPKLPPQSPKAKNSSTPLSPASIPLESYRPPQSRRLPRARRPFSLQSRELSQKHLPGFVEKSAELNSKGVDTIACISVNDAFVMKAWKENHGINEEVLLLSDGNGDFTKAIGCELDWSDKPIGLGVRSRRYALLAEDGVVKVLNLEEGCAFTFSNAEDMA